MSIGKRQVIGSLGVSLLTSCLIRVSTYFQLERFRSDIREDFLMMDHKLHKDIDDLIDSTAKLSKDAETVSDIRRD